MTKMMGARANTVYSVSMVWTAKALARLCMIISEGIALNAALDKKQVDHHANKDDQKHHRGNR